MGMDVYGKRPTSEVGRYFGNNVWWWHPLAEYVCGVAPQITAACTYWGSNDGDGLGAKASSKLADALQVEIDAGRTAEYALNRMAQLEALPRLTCNICNGTGVRTDAIGIEYGWDRKLVTAPEPDESDQTPNPRIGQIGSCNACHGRGTVPHFETHYPFSVENVRGFVAFLRESGGFRIC